MKSHKLNDPITKFLWPLGVGMLTGWVVLDLFLLAILKNGGRIESWHAGIWITATLVGVWIALGGRKTEDGGRLAVGGGQTTEGGRWRTEGRDQKTEGIRHPASGIRHQIGVSGILTCIAVLLPLAFSWIMGKFTDVSWDGMTSLGIMVRNLMIGQMDVGQLSLGIVTAGFLAKLTDNWQAGKGINVTLIWISVCFAIGGLKNLKIRKTNKIIMGLLAGLNPVGIYQSSSFQNDGHIASIFCCLCFAGLKHISASKKTAEDYWAFAISFVGLCAAKKTGLFYGLILVIIVFCFFLLNKGKVLEKTNYLKIVAFIFVALFSSYLSLIMTKVSFGDLVVSRVFDIRSSGYGVGGGGARVREYVNLPRPVLFAASAFSMTEGSPEKINLKPPFWTTRREIRIFEELFPDPRAGGFGPFYSTAFLLAGLGCLGLLAAGKWKYAPGWFLVLASFGSSYFSQIWWARWTPQNWLLVIGMLMPLLAYGFGSSKVGALRGLRVEGLKGLGEQGLGGEEVQRLTGWKGTWVRTCAVLGMIAAFLNVGIIALYYGIGMVRQERILDSQMYVASQLPQPLPIYLQRENYVFIASKYWLEERGISTREVAQNVGKPRMKINRTHTRFPLPENWRSLLRRPEDEKVLRERGLVEE